MIDENSDIREFIKFVKTGLEKKFSLNLSIEKSFSNEKNLIFDLADIDKRFFVEIKPLMKNISWSKIIQQINTQKNTLKKIYPKEKISHVLVFQNAIRLKEKEKFSYELQSNIGQQYVFDIGDITNMNNVSFLETIHPSEKSNHNKENTLESDDKSFDKLKESIGNPNYYLAGHLWDGKDQLPRFIEGRIWENGHDRNDTYAVNSANKNDIVYIKTTYVKDRISFLRIKAIGVIVNNSKDGHNLEVNWHLFNRHINIENLGKYRRTFARVDDHDVNTILDNIIQEEPELTSIIKNLKIVKNKKEEEVKPEIITNTTTVAGLISDVDSGADYLSIDKDVNAFAKVMAAKSFNPPLAIALLGKWGSGKSFFMRKLKERIEKLSYLGAESKAYCGGIAHVHFNAWSYMDADLWAGIITKIFEGLQEYISEDTKAKKDILNIEKEITKKLNIAQDELKKLEQKKESIEENIKSLTSKKGQAEKSLKSKIDKIKHKSLKSILDNLDKEFKISEKVTTTLSKNESFNKSVDTFSKIVPKEYWQNPKELYQKTKSIYAYIRAFFKGTTWQSNLTWIGLIAIFVLIMKGIIFLSNLYLLDKDFSFSIKTWSSITLISSFIIRHVQTIKQLQPIIASFYKIKEDYELQKKDVIFKVNQTEKALKLEIENHKNEIQSLNQHINKAQHSKAELEYRLNNTLSTEALFSFIEKRAVSNDYKKHLGIVSIIRKDFEILSELFTGHNDELNNSEESEEFQKQFERPLERIILYIDDLDRCPNERVIEVLEAVNLLMAYPLFVVVVGVDPRWVKNALDEKYTSQFKNNTSNKESIEPSGYLEKIFQIPFQLKSANDNNVKHMLRELAETTLIDDSDNYKESENTSIDKQDEKDPIFGENVFEDNVFEEIPESIIENVIESIKFSDKEVELIQSMSPILGSNPRALKRYVNIYRVIKAHEEFKFNSNELDILTVIFLIALPIGKYKALYTSFSNDLVKQDKTYTLATYLLEHTLKNEYDNLDQTEYHKEDSLKAELYSILKDISSKLLSQNLDEFRKHHVFIKRFTFSNL